MKHKILVVKRKQKKRKGNVIKWIINFFISVLFGQTDPLNSILIIYSSPLHPLLFTTHSIVNFSAFTSHFLPLCLLHTHPSPIPPLFGRPFALTLPSRSAAAVTGGQEVKAKVECHTHRVTPMLSCCVSLWMEGSECQTRWRALTPWLLPELALSRA